MSSCNTPPNTPPNPPNLWSRATLSCVNYDQEQLNMRRKAEILKYKGNQNPLTKNQQWARIVNGNGPLAKKVWATQNDLGSDPNVFNLEQVGNTLIECPTTEYNYFAYVANNSITGIDGVSGYTINPTTGALTDIGTFTAGFFPQSITVDPTGKFAYVANNGSGNVSGYTINPTTGALVAIATFTAGLNPSSVTVVVPSGKFAYVANDGSGNVSGYTINPTTGALAAMTPPTFSAGLNPSSVTVDPSGKFAYVANDGSGNISGYMISPTTGALAAIAGSPFSAGLNPASVTVDPNGKFAYVANFGSIVINGNISGYTINPTTGALTAIGTFSAGLKPNSVTVDPTGKFAYVANNGSSNVSGYTINPSTGALTAMIPPTFSAGLKPISVTVDPTGKFAYVANSGSGNISGYTINPSTGALTAIGTFPSVIGPISITTARIPKPKTIICEPSSASDVPGNSVLCYDPSVPLVNYLPPQRTFLAGGTKWPQYSWQPGDNGFPRGKKGMRMLFQ